MWILTPIGFFSVVQKEGDEQDSKLTIRARVAADLDELRKRYLPELSDTVANGGTDYRFRARAPRAAVEAAMASLIGTIDYSNFKNAVIATQGRKRGAIYHEVWDALYKLQQ